jgi:succinate-acetate transporter protein
MSTTVNESGAVTPGDVAADPGKGIADPGPLGLAAFALTTFLLSLFNAGIAPENLEKTVLPLALFYGGLAQLIAGIWEFRKANTFGATAFCSYGPFWMAFAAFVQFVEPSIPEASAKTATGLFLLGWAIFTLYMLVASLRTNGALIGVFAFLFLTFLFLVLGTLAGVSALATIGGILGIITALVAWYASFAVVTNATWGRTVLPVGPR